MAEDKRIAVIMPQSLHQQVLDLAKKDKRSLNAYIVLMIEKRVSEESPANG